MVSKFSRTLKKISGFFGGIKQYFLAASRSTQGIWLFNSCCICEASRAGGISKNQLLPQTAGASSPSACPPSFSLFPQPLHGGLTPLWGSHKADFYLKFSEPSSNLARVPSYIQSLKCLGLFLGSIDAMLGESSKELLMDKRLKGSSLLAPTSIRPRDKCAPCRVNRAHTLLELPEAVMTHLLLGWQQDPASVHIYCGHKPESIHSCSKNVSCPFRLL